MKIFRLSLLVILCSVVTLTWNTGRAQTRLLLEENTKELPTNVFGFGVNFSLATGAGFSFRHHLAKSPLSYMVTGYGWKSRDELTYDFGFEVQYDFYLRQSTRFYGLAGASYFYDWVRGDGMSFDPDGNLVPDNIRHNKLAAPYRLGAGLGYEIALGSTVGFYLNVTATSFQPEGAFSVYPYGGAHIYFK